MVGRSWRRSPAAGRRVVSGRVSRSSPRPAWYRAPSGYSIAWALTPPSKADFVVTGEGSFDRTSLVGKASGEVIRRAQAAKKRVAVVAGKVEGLIGIHALD